MADYRYFTDDRTGALFRTTWPVGAWDVWRKDGSGWSPVTGDGAKKLVRDVQLGGDLTPAKPGDVPEAAR